MACWIGPSTCPGALISVSQLSATAFSQLSRNTLNSRSLSSPVREQPAIFDAEHADRNAALLDEVEHLRVRHAFVEAALEVGAAQLHRVEAAFLCGFKRLAERRGVDRPHVQREAAEFRSHSLLLSFVFRM